MEHYFLLWGKFGPRVSKFEKSSCPVCFPKTKILVPLAYRTGGLFLWGVRCSGASIRENARNSVLMISKVKVLRVCRLFFSV